MSGKCIIMMCAALEMTKRSNMLSGIVSCYKFIGDVLEKFIPLSDKN